MDYHRKHNGGLIMSADENNFATTIPVGPLGIIALNSCEPIGKKVDAYISADRKSVV